MHFKEKTAPVGNSVNRDTTERGLSTNVHTFLITQRELVSAKVNEELTKRATQVYKYPA